MSGEERAGSDPGVERDRGAAPGGGFAGPDLLFAVLLALHVALVVAPRWAPLQDLGVHLDSSAVLGDLLLGTASPVVQRYYELESDVSPTWGAHLVLAALLRWLPPEWVENLALSLYMLALALAARHLASRASPDGGWRAVIFLPLALSFPFHMGFLSYGFSLPILLWLLALWLPEGAPERRNRRLLRLAFVAMLLAVAHPVTWVVGALAVGCLVLHEAISSPSVLPTLRRRGAEAVATVGPAALLVAFFAADESERALRSWPFGVMWRSLATLNSLVSFDRREIYVATAWGFVLLAASIWAWIHRRREKLGRDRFDGLLWATAACVVLYFLSPDAAAGGNWIVPRLGLSCWLLLTSWLVLQPWPRAQRTALAVAVTAVSVGWLTLHGLSYSRMEAAYEEVRMVSRHLAPGQTLLSLVFLDRELDDEGRPLSIKVSPLLHVGSRLAVERGLVDVGNYQAAAGYFPIVFRPEVDPEGRLWRRTDGGRHLDLAGYHRDTQGTIDYVLLWGYRPGGDYLRRDIGRLGRDLAEAYDLVLASPRRRVLLFARRDDAQETTSPGAPR